MSPTLSSCEHTLNTLRYADRVKELGATEPLRGSDGAAGDEELTHNEQLRTLNGEECDEEWVSKEVHIAVAC